MQYPYCTVVNNTCHAAHAHVIIFLDICKKLNQYTMAVDGNRSGGIEDLTDFIVDFNHHKNCNWRLIFTGKMAII